MREPLFTSLGGRFNRLYLDRDNAWLFGVCAGVADFFDIDLTVLRAITVLMAIFFTFPMIVIYGLAAMLLRDKPLRPVDPRHEREFWRRADHYGNMHND